MKKTGIIARHEFTTTIRRISYILLTLSFPVLGLLGMLVFMGVANWGGEGTPPEEFKIGYVDNTGIFNDYTNPEGAVFIVYDTNDEAMEALFTEELNEYFVIPEDYDANGRLSHR